MPSSTFDYISLSYRRNPTSVVTSRVLVKLLQKKKKKKKKRKKRKKTRVERTKFHAKKKPITTVVVDANGSLIKLSLTAIIQRSWSKMVQIAGRKPLFFTTSFRPVFSLAFQLRKVKIPFRSLIIKRIFV